MRVLFEGPVEVHYRFITVHHVKRGPNGKTKKEHAGQENGLCGAAVPGFLSLVTGLHTGVVGCTVELHPAEPALGEQSEEIVEVSFATKKKRLGLHGFESQYEFSLPKGEYRVRYCPGVWTPARTGTPWTSARRQWTTTCCSSAPAVRAPTASCGRPAEQRPTGTARTPGARA
jgi:hypothetical protein